MADNYNTSPITRHSSDTMEETVERPLAAIAIPDKVDAEKTAVVDDGESDKDPKEKEAKEEKEGSLKDYFVSQISDPV
jgi:hypothetical protein